MSHLTASELSCALGVKKPVLLELMRESNITEPITAQQAKAWRKRPERAPEWLRPQYQQRIERREMRKQARERRANTPGMELIPVAVAGTLGCSRVLLARAAYAAGVDAPLTLEEARSWRDRPGTGPSWYLDLFSELQAKRVIAEADAVARDAAARDSVTRKLASGRTRFTDEEEQYAADIAFGAIKEIWRGAREEDLLPEERAALDWAGIEEEDRRTWKEQRDEETVQNAMENLERQQERARWSAQNEAHVASGRFEVGQYVECFNGERIGVVVKKNRVTVRVRRVGGKKDGWQVLETGIKPFFLTPMATPPHVPQVGEALRLECWDRRVREAEVLAVEGHLFLAQYRIASGQERQWWFDSKRIVREG